MKAEDTILIAVTILFLFFACSDTIAQNSQTEWKFVSIPDFTNVDVNFPEPKWDDALITSSNR